MIPPLPSHHEKWDNLFKVFLEAKRESILAIFYSEFLTVTLGWKVKLIQHYLHSEICLNRDGETIKGLL